MRAFGRGSAKRSCENSPRPSISVAHPARVKCRPCDPAFDWCNFTTRRLESAPFYPCNSPSILAIPAVKRWC